MTVPIVVRLLPRPPMLAARSIVARSVIALSFVALSFVALSFVALSMVLPMSPADAATDGACPTSAGVTVVVDFQGLGGGTITRCAPGSYDNGLAALAGAGFAVVEPVNTPMFVCRIDGAPTPATEACVDTPPHTAYWGYWRAPRGGAWTYSTIGAGSKGTAKPGSVQGWSFSDGSNPPPRFVPPAVAAPVTSPPPTNPTPTPTNPVVPGPGGSSPTTVAPGGPPAAPGVTMPRVVGGAAPTTAVPGATNSPGSTIAAVAPIEMVPVDGTTSSVPVAADASVLGTSEVAPSTTEPDPAAIELASARRAAAADVGGSPWSTLISVAVVGALAGATWVLKHRRIDI